MLVYIGDTNVLALHPTLPVLRFAISSNFYLFEIFSTFTFVLGYIALNPFNIFLKFIHRHFLSPLSIACLLQFHPSIKSFLKL